MISTSPPPRAFASYSWDDEPHKLWVRDLAERLRGDGVDTTLDRWHTAPGDRLPQFMETAVRENNFVLVICTPRYKEKSDKRIGGVGYEGDVMTGEVFTMGNRRKFIPVLRRCRPEDAIPSWLSGAYFVDLRGEPYREENYQDLLFTIHGVREQAPPLGPPPVLKPKHGEPEPAKVEVRQPLDHTIRIIGIAVDEVGRPKNDGTYGSALYAVPFQLSTLPSYDWSRVFVEKWNHPPEFTTMHRPGIARVQGSRIILDGTTVEEVEKYHRKTLILAVDETNCIIEEYEAKKRREAEREAAELREHEESVRDAATRIKFD